MGRVADLNRARHGTVDERADRILAFLRNSDTPVKAPLIRAALGMGNGMVGGALSRLRERGDAYRVGGGWRAR